MKAKHASPMKGRKQSPEVIVARLGRKYSKEFIAKMCLLHQDQFGEKIIGWNTIWIDNGFENKRIKKNIPIPLNWTLGRYKKILTRE